MSSDGDNSAVFDDRNFNAVWTLAMEPSYVSEIARKMQNIYDDWAEMEENTAVRIVAKIVYAMENNLDMETVKMGADAGGQHESSPKNSFSPGGFMTTDAWRDYKVVYNRSGNMDEANERALEYVDLNMTLEDKLDKIRDVSKWGNDVSKEAERIMQDVLLRQFRHYDTKEVPDYNDPGVDFYVEDEGNREWGLCVEISTRYVNPIDKPYVESKKEEAIKRDADLIILAPRFTDGMLEKYESDDDEFWHSDPEGEMVHLHKVPKGDFDVYRPFIPVEDDSIETGGGEGNPIIVPDSEKLRGRIKSFGLVGEDYPVVDDDYESFVDLLDEVNRDWVAVTESRYRNFIRESIEPALWEFLRPYKIEQFIIDMYWDKDLTQDDIGRLVDRSGNTIGRWMREHGIMRRRGGAPELSEEVVEIWRRMYEGEDPFPEQFSGYRIQAEYNRHPMWGLNDWRNWYKNTTESERQESVRSMGSFRDNLDYTVMVGATERLLPSYSFILSTLRDNDVEIRPPDEAPRVPYSAYPNRDALEYMINKNQDTIVEVSDNE